VLAGHFKAGRAGSFKELVEEIAVSFLHAVIQSLLRWLASGLIARERQRSN
jgi:hypothetical protein